MTPPLIALDVRDARRSMPHGSGLYARRLEEALLARDGGAFALWPVEDGWPGPELAWEQIGLPRALRRRHAAVVHSPANFLPLRRPCPGVVTIHDLTFERYPEDFPAKTAWKFRTFASRAARSAERVIVDSEATAADLEATYGLDRARVRVIPLAPSLPVGDAPVPEGGPYLLYAGDLRPKKNVGRLVEAWRSLRARGLEHRLVLAGADFGEAARLRAPADGDAGLELPGFVSDAELDALLRGAAALVHPSLYEGFGLIVVEAMARGCPVAAADATALPGTVGDAGVLFDPLDPADIARGIEAVLARRDELAEAGRAHVAGLSWAATAAATAAVYEELL